MRRIYTNFIRIVKRKSLKAPHLYVIYNQESDTAPFLLCIHFILAPYIYSSLYPTPIVMIHPFIRRSIYQFSSTKQKFFNPSKSILNISFFIVFRYLFLDFCILCCVMFVCMYLWDLMVKKIFYVLFSCFLNLNYKYIRMFLSLYL